MWLKPFSTKEVRDVDKAVGKLEVYAEHDGEARLLSDLFKFLQESKNIEYLVDILHKMKDNK